jgi:hypothetical protein
MTKIQERLTKAGWIRVSESRRGCIHDIFWRAPGENKQPVPQNVAVALMRLRALPKNY